MCFLNVQRLLENKKCGHFVLGHAGLFHLGFIPPFIIVNYVKYNKLVEIVIFDLKVWLQNIVK